MENHSYPLIVSRIEAITLANILLNEFRGISMNQNIMPGSLTSGSTLGLLAGGLLGGGLGAITGNMNGILTGAGIGAALGLLDGILVAALTVRTAGTNGGVSIGAYTGMGAGSVIGFIVGMLIPTSLRMSANTEGLPVLDALVLGRFETVVLFSFFLCVIGTMVGTWISGRNLYPKNTKS